MVPKKEIGRCFKLIQPLIARSSQKGIGIVSTEDFVVRFCSHLRLPIEVQKVSIQVLKKCTELGCTAGKSPISVASAAIFLVSHLFPNCSKTFKEINTISSVSEGTIKSTYREMYQRRRDLVPFEVSTEIVDALPAV